MKGLDWADLALLVGVLMIGYWVGADFGLAALFGYLGALLLATAVAVRWRRPRG
jgi:hypothetical protein